MLRETEGPAIVYVDVNGRPVEWGIELMDGWDWVSSSLPLAARPPSRDWPTGRQYPRLLASEAIVWGIDWKGIEDYTGSHNQYITYRVTREERLRHPTLGWHVPSKDSILRHAGPAETVTASICLVRRVCDFTTPEKEYPR